jgi:8-oxo-dGTP pyrophosphatase MutT (NUDIX family)
VSAAVLVPITDHGGPHLLFTKKTSSVPHHKGQFSFPGGVVDVRDGSRVETALREAWEEIRLPSEAVEVLGLLDDTPTRATNFIITPVVGIVRDPVEFRPDGREIERVLEVPLQTLRDPAIFRTEIWERNGEPHPVLFYEVSMDDVIWGATARILSQFLALLDEPEVPA